MILEAAGDRGLALPIAESVASMLEAAESAGLGDSDMSAIHRALASD